MNKFTAAIRERGWLAKDIAERWGIQPRAMSKISAKPKQIHWDALAGLPEPPSKKTK